MDATAPNTSNFQTITTPTSQIDAVTQIPTTQYLWNGSETFPTSKNQPETATRFSANRFYSAVSATELQPIVNEASSE